MPLKHKVDSIMDKEMNMPNIFKFNINERIIHHNGLIILIKKRIKLYEKKFIIHEKEKSQLLFWIF